MFDLSVFRHFPLSVFHSPFFLIFIMKKSSLSSVILGAAFLMATSAVGPGFLTQTAKFTATLAASFGFVILLSVILDIFAQLNIWRVLTVSEKRAQDVANETISGSGYV